MFNLVSKCVLVEVNPDCKSRADTICDLTPDDN